MDIITEFVGGLPDAILEVWDMPVQRNMPVSVVMLPVIGSNPPTGGSDSGFTMSFEFNGLSRSGVLCGEDFIRYRPFKDSPEEILVEEEFDWGALWGNVAIGLGVVTAVVGGVVYCASIAFTGGASAVFAPYVMGGLTAVGGSWLVVSQAEKDYARGEVSSWTTYANSALAGSAHGAIAGYAFCMAPYAAPALLYGTGAGYAGSMVGLSEEMMISLTETALYALNFSNIVVQGSDMVESTTGKNALRDALGDDLYRMVGQISETGAAVTVIAGLSNPYYYVKNNQAAHFEQVPRADGLVTNRIPDNNSTTGHIFRDAEGHIPDTPENRALLENIANDAENFRGIDKYGNEWYTKILENGREVWVESRNGNIFEGGINEIPKSWNPNTGLKKQ